MLGDVILSSVVLGNVNLSSIVFGSVILCSNFATTEMLGCSNLWSCDFSTSSFCFTGNLKNRESEIELQDQTITISAVGAHHQNGVAERNIQTSMSWAFSMMLHQLLHWPDAFDKALWPFALEHAVYLKSLTCDEPLDSCFLQASTC